MAAGNVLIVDDEESIRDVLSSLLQAAGYQCALATNGDEALLRLQAGTFDLVLSDILMPGMDGLTLLQHLRDEQPDLPVVMVTAMHDISAAIGAIRAGAYDYLLKPFEKEQLYLCVRRALEHHRLVVENRKYQEGLEQLVAERTGQLSAALRELEQSYDYTLEALGGALDLKDAETEGHCERVTAYTILIGRAMGLDQQALRQIARGAFLHDIGKMGIPDVILRKPAPLSETERKIMRQHCEIGFNVLEDIPFLRPAAEIVLTHQEHYDGNGYPNGLRRDQIPLGARIFAVADALDAMISDRPYRKAMPLAAARDEIRRCAGTQFDPAVVEAFLAFPEETWLKYRDMPDGAFRMAELAATVPVARKAAPPAENPAMAAASPDPRAPDATD